MNVHQTKHWERTTNVLDELMQTLGGEVHAFTVAADKLEGSSTSTVTLFRSLSQQRKDFRNELHQLANEIDYRPKEPLSDSSDLTPPWQGLDQLIESSDNRNVVRAIEVGEENALRVYTSACEKDLLPKASVLINHQRGAIAAAFSHLQTLAKTTGE
jgi:uncharacterized protein (TIGR02284 family)